MLHNPYAKRKIAAVKPPATLASSTTTTMTTTSSKATITTQQQTNNSAAISIQKRPDRPWESTFQTANKTTKTAPPVTDNSSSNSNSSVSTTPQKQSKANNEFDFDDGFDWSLAMTSCDTAMAQSCNYSEKEQRYASPGAAAVSAKENNSNKGVGSSAASNPFVAQRSLYKQFPENKFSTKNVKEGLPPRPSNYSSKSKPPERGIAPGQTTLASLRPDSWGSNKSRDTHASSTPEKTTKRAPTSPQAIPPPPYGDVRQAKLPRKLQFDPASVRPLDDGNYKTMLAHANLRAPLKNGWMLFPHQMLAIEKSLEMRRFILALDMGLGKTLIGCVWASSFLKSSLLRCKHAFVICPVSLNAEWQRTAEEATGLTVVAAEKKPATSKTVDKKKKAKNSSLLDDESDSSSDEDEDYVKGDEAASLSPTVSIHSWGKLPEIPQRGNYVVVADEAHMIQSIQAKRTQETLKIVHHERCVGVLLLTGTPMKNGKPSNLFPLLKATRHPLGKHQRVYEEHFCEGKEVRFGNNNRPVWQANGAANLDQLRELSQSHMLHLTKEKCLKDLPPQTRVFEQVPVSSRQQIQHNQAIQELAKAHDMASKKGGGGASNDQVLGAVQKLRAVGSMAKVDATVERAKTVLEEEPAVVIFTSFQEPARSVHKKLSEAGWHGEILTGETPPKKRQDMVDNFQKGVSPVMVCTFGVGGVGLTLTAARTVILLDRPWTPGDVHQAEDRVRRIGQIHPVTSVWIRAFELDKQIDQLIAHKSLTSSTVLGENAAGQDAKGMSQKISIAKIISLAVSGTASTGSGSSAAKQTSILQFSQPKDG